MAVGKEIRTKIKSIQNTQKITKAMEMVAASKMRKAQDRMEASRPYAEEIRTVIGHLRMAQPGLQAAAVVRARGSEACRLYHRVHRSRSVRWAQCQSVPHAAERDASSGRSRASRSISA